MKVQINYDLRASRGATLDRIYSFWHRIRRLPHSSIVIVIVVVQFLQIDAITVRPNATVIPSANRFQFDSSDRCDPSGYLRLKQVPQNMGIRSSFLKWTFIAKASRPADYLAYDWPNSQSEIIKIRIGKIIGSKTDTSNISKLENRIRTRPRFV